MIDFNTLSKFIPNIIYSLIILCVGLFAAYLVKKILKQYIHLHNNEMLKNFLGNLASGAVILLTAISVLSKLGVPTASLVAVAGAAGLAIALSLKDFLSNIAAGFMIVFLKPFKVGDFVKINSDSGTVTDINLFMVALKSSTNECLFIPNNKVITNNVLNQSFYDTRRVDLVIGVDYNTDLAKAKEILNTILSNHQFILTSPAFSIGIQELADSAINVLVRYWVNKPDLLQSKLSLNEEIAVAFKAANINIPFPQMDVHITSEKLAVTLDEHP